ncbi:MAG: thiamine-phosphate kinase, partial [Terriglobia bacterium]
MLKYALSGGEDYELLFTVSSKRVTEVSTKIDGVPVRDIGKIVPRSQGIKIIRANGTVEPLPPSGWDHFQ